MASPRPNQGPPRYQPQNRRVSGPIIYDSTRPQMMNSNPLGHVPVHPSQATQPMMFGSMPAVPQVGFGAGNYYLAPNVSYSGNYPGMPFGNPQNYYQLNSDVSSGSSSASNSSQSSPYSIPSSASSLYSQQSYNTPTHHENPSVQSIILTYPQVGADMVEIHPLLRPESFHSSRRIQWDVNFDPSSALCNEVKIPDETVHEPAFMPSRHTIMIVLGFDASEERGFALMELDDKMRSFWFPISAYIVRSGGRARVEGVEVQSQSQKIPNVNGASGPQRELDLHMVLSNIYNIMRIPVTKELWSQLTIREKLVAAKRLSARRTAYDRLSCVEWLQEIAELETRCFELEEQGLPVSERSITKMKAAHEQLDSYAFHRDTDFKAWSVRAPPIIGDFMGARTMFKGLQRLQMNPGDLDTFFLCVA